MKALKEIESMLEKMLERQLQILTKMNRIETRFAEIASRIEKFMNRQDQLEKEFELFKGHIIEQVSWELMRSKGFYH